MNALVAAIAALGIVLGTAAPLAAQPTGEATIKQLLDDENVRVVDVTYPPGATVPAVARPTHQTGEAYWQDPDTAAVANAGSNTVHVVVTYMKK